MSGASETDLVARLRPHLRHRFDLPGPAWWTPPPRRWAPWHGSSRVEQLTQVVERLALLTDLGDGLAAAVAEAAAVGRGPVAIELAAVGDALTAGRSPAEAFHGWARRARCGHVGVLAAELRGCTSSDALAAVLWHGAATLRRVGHERRMRALRRRVGALWLLAAAVCASSLALVA